VVFVFRLKGARAINECMYTCTARACVRAFINGLLSFVIRLKFKTKNKYDGHKFVTAIHMFRPKFKPNHKFKTKHKYDMNPTIMINDVFNNLCKVSLYQELKLNIILGRRNAEAS